MKKMKINLLKLNSRLKNKVRSLPSIHAYNYNDNSLNNISSTTNASIIKNTPINNSILIEKYQKKYRPLKKIKFNNNRSISMDSKAQYFSTKNINKKTLELLENADYILEKRNKLKILDLEERKYKIKNFALELNKKLSEKNYFIKLLKKNRIQIVEKEFLINKSLKEYNKQLNLDYKNFNNFILNEKNIQYFEDQTINKYKEIGERLEEQIKEELLLNKRLEIILEKKIKDLYVIIDYGIFFHRLIDRPFLFGTLSKIGPNAKDYKKIASTLFNLYEKRDNYNLLPKELEDEDLFMKKYRLLEDSLRSALILKETVEKELISKRALYEEELKQNKLILIGLKNELKNLSIKKNEIKNEFINNETDSNSLSNYLKYFIDLGKQLIPEEKIPIITDEDCLTELLNYINSIKKVLANIENKINNNILTIENVFKTGAKKDKELMEKIINTQKSFYKLGQRKILNEIIMEKKFSMDKKIFEKYKTIAIKGRKIIFDYRIKSKNKVKKKIDRKEDGFILDYFDTLNENEE